MDQYGSRPMKKWLIPLACSVLVLVASGADARRASKWAAYLETGFTYMDVKTGPLRRTSVLHGDGVTYPYHYVIYKATNRGKEAFAIYPSVRLMMESGGRNADVLVGAVRETLQQQLNRDLFSSIEIDKKLRKEHAQELLRSGSDPKSARPMLMPGKSITGLAVFANIDPAADVMELVITGLTDSYRIETVHGKKRILTEAYTVEFYRPGDEYHPARTYVEMRKPKWRFVPVRRLSFSTDLVPKPGL